MHVVQALVALNLGGSELVATELTQHLTQHGHRVTVIAADGPLKPRIIDAGADHLDWSIGKKRLGTLGYIRQLADWLFEQQPDVLHVHSRLPAWICFLAIRRLKPHQRPVFITTMHGHYSVSRYSAIMARGDSVIAVSNHIRDYTLRNYPMADPDSIVTIHGGTSSDAFPFGYQPDKSWFEQTFKEFPQLRGKRLLCLPGRLSRWKGHSAFIELCAAVINEFPDIHGIIVGKAKPGSRFRSELEGLAMRSGLADRLTFVGARMDIREWMAASEIVFNLSGDPPEAFGRTLPEALHLGVPGIGWNHGGVREVLAEMFPQGAVEADNPAALLEKTREFLNKRPEVLPSNAFSLAESMKSSLNLYQSLLSNRATEVKS